MLTWNLIQKMKHQKKLYKSKGCINCAYKVICDYNIYCVLYTELISCKRAFSKLKLIKTRLRSNMTKAIWNNF
ncbi:hypothetical protein PR048_012962 [Dryococelus australis]|uniref:Uncharacterized protein n=1 Tax=Dryococelus australis TaxID=614101 RepID=A0ABQ9HRI9_9NEOP|nr:hypothetical protein PR048_012962 [Dryococelus australis]